MQRFMARYFTCLLPLKISQNVKACIMLLKETSIYSTAKPFNLDRTEN